MPNQSPKRCYLRATINGTSKVCHFTGIVFINTLICTGLLFIGPLLLLGALLAEVARLGGFESPTYAEYRLDYVTIATVCGLIGGALTWNIFALLQAYGVL